MKFAAVKNNQYTGVIYSELTPEIQNWADTTEGISLAVISSETEALIKLAEMQAGDDEPVYPEVSQDVICETVRYLRDSTITAFEWRINRNAQEIELGLDTTDDRVKLLQYMQYLRDLPAQSVFPEVEIKNFEEWEDENS